MEERENGTVQSNAIPEGNVTPENVETNVVPTVEESKELDTSTPIQEKLSEIEEKQDMVIPDVVKEVAEPAIEAASVAAGETKVEPEKVKVKKPTKKDPIIMYGENVVLWYIEC